MDEDTIDWMTANDDPGTLERLRVAMKERKISAAELARCAGKSPSWGAAVMRGNYPFMGAGRLPKGFWQVAVRMGLIPKRIEEVTRG